MRFRSCLALLLVTFALRSSADAATLLVSGSGILTGATGVNVEGTLYDVEFVDGTCAALFDGCDSVNDFTFSTEADALVASQRCLIKYSSIPHKVSSIRTPASHSGASTRRSACALR